ncbi:hypothetical protein DPMN_085795 [Dreissena polymorpha]|uniref:Uncharacterized protein n=1 Tax=Dreissena polymorpha TaxID=45954 RepID=A0A9D3YGE7_DREPO|nr:hypothetical protein DPMN_085795 [Dreissena polymorpha]
MRFFISPQVPHLPLTRDKTIIREKRHESWALYASKEKMLTFSICLHIPSIATVLHESCLRFLGHVRRMDNDRIPNDTQQGALLLAR